MIYSQGELVQIRRPSEREFRRWLRQLLDHDISLSYDAYVNGFDYIEYQRIDGVHKEGHSVGINGRWFPIDCVIDTDSLFNEE